MRIRHRPSSSCPSSSCRTTSFILLVFFVCYKRSLLRTSPQISSYEIASSIQAQFQTIEDKPKSRNHVDLIMFEADQSNELGILRNTKSKTNPQTPTNVSVMSDDSDRALFAISMGKKAENTTLVERFVWSARNVGNFSGWIVVLTDAEPNRYERIHTWTDNVIFMHPEKQDIKQQYKIPNMQYKRFKTLVLEYVQKDRRLDNVMLVYYLDVDIIFGNLLLPFFQGLEEKYLIRTGAPSKAGGHMWMFRGNGDFGLQSGQIVYHRTLSLRCEERWRALFDKEENKAAVKDQDLLAIMLQEQNNATKSNELSTLACKIGIMEQEGFIEFPRATQVKSQVELLQKGEKKRGDVLRAPVIHLRNDGVISQFSAAQLQYYLQDILHLDQQKINELGIATSHVMEVTPS